MSAPLNSISIQLPQWLTTLNAADTKVYASSNERMQLVLALARQNVEEKTGGPFAAAIFNMDDHTLLAAGVNLVVPANCSMAHAEMVAISIAQKKLATYDLGAQGLPSYELITSTEPCAMCFGALPWSGIRHLVCGARDEDARAIGFDEGPKMVNWQVALQQRGISVETEICRGDAIAILQDYAAQNGEIYNARQG